MTASQKFKDAHDSAFNAHCNKKWQSVLDLLIPIIPQIKTPIAVNRKNEFEVRFYADCNYLIAYSFHKLHSSKSALPYARQHYRLAK